MSRRLEALVERRLGALAAWCVRWRRVVIAAYLGLAVLAGWYTLQHIAIDTDTADMLDARLPWRVAYAAYEEAFPYFDDTFVVVVDAHTPDRAREAARLLAAALAVDTRHFSEVFHPEALPFFRAHQLLYLDSEALSDLIDDLSRGQPLLGQLASDPGLHGLLGLLETLASAGADVPATAIADFVAAVDASLVRFLAGDRRAMSWVTLLAGERSTPSRRVVFTVAPRLDYGRLLPAGEAMAALRTHVANLGFVDADDVRVRVTGGAALAHDELQSVIVGGEQAALLALVLVAACLVLGLRSGSLVLATLVALFVGLTLTACFATLAVGTLNMISLAFAVLYVGLGVDFAIHLCLRYRELLTREGRRSALLHSVRHVGLSLVLCAITTAVAFFAFLPTAYRGVAELGLISGVGILIGLAVSLSLLPALLAVLPAPRVTPARPRRWLPRPDGRARRLVLPATLVLALAALGLAPRVTFDHNPVRLNDPDAESVTTLAELESEATLHAIAVMERADAVAALVAELTALPTVDAVATVADLLPDAQAEKLALIDDLAFTLGDALELAAPTPPSWRRIRPALDAVDAAIAARAGTDAPAAAAFDALRRHLAELRTRLEAVPPTATATVLGELEQMLMHHFPTLVADLAKALDAGPVTLDELPPALRARWVSASGWHRLEVRPRADLRGPRAEARFVDEVRAVAGDDATGTPVINIEAGRAVTTAFTVAFLGAAAFIVALLGVLLRSPREVAIVLAPLGLAALLTTACTVLAGISFNFANIIALPLLLGIGVDSALHILHRYKTTGQDDLPLLGTSAARGVLFSALTSAASFGNLAASPHAGTASMGLLLSAGLAITLSCTLLVLPALLRQFVTPSGSLT